MKKTLVSIALLGVSLTMAQVGINTEEPKATLDVVSSPADLTKTDGFIAPRLTGDELRVKNALYNAPDQTGAVIYATAADSAPAGKTVNVTEEGYYYFDGAVWVKFGSGAGAPGTEPWYVQNTTTQATANNQNIYQQGKVAVGFTDADAVSGKQFEVKGDVKSVVNNAGTYSILETNNTDFFGIPINLMGSADNTDVLAANNYGLLSSYSGSTGSGTTIEAKGAEGTASVGANVTPGPGSRAEMRTGNPTVTNAVIVGSNGATDGNEKVVLLSENTAAITATRLHVDKTNGVTLKYGGIMSPSGNYTFPQNNGTAGQVLVTDGALPTLTTGAQLSWQNVSDLAPEPWRIQGTTNPATSNTQNIYQTGNVSIGSQDPIAPFTSNGSTITPKLSVTGDVATTGAFYTNASKYADYVFQDYFDGSSTINEDYKFKSLEETAAYIKENKHLPGVTSIKDILKTDNGYTVNLSELSIQQLEKIEELYLHTIEQQNLIEKQEAEIQDMRSRLENLEALLLKENNNK